MHDEADLRGLGGRKGAVGYEKGIDYGVEALKSLFVSEPRKGNREGIEKAKFKKDVQK